MFDDGVEDDEEFSHGGDQGHEFGFSRVNESLIERFELSIVPDGHDGGHVEGLAEQSPSAAGGSLPSERAAVAVGGSDANESCDLFVVELSEFGKFADQGCGGGWSNAGHRAEQFGFGLQGLVVIDELLELLIDLVELPVVEFEGLLDQSADVWFEGGGQAVLFLNSHVLDLSASGGEIGDFLLDFWSWRGRPGVHAFGEESNAAGINGVGLGELTGGSGKVADLAGIHDGDGEMVLLESADELAFESAGRFKTDQAWPDVLEPNEEAVETCDGVFELLDFVGRGMRDVELAFADIDPDNGLNDRHRHESDPTLQMRAGEVLHRSGDCSGYDCKAR